ncbi:MAG: hypothetical protein EOO17_03380 [Chloroflexi bacterium]|nr:MAG: hypothetical protein EOO17_03380 [Chloroflexota bacterium]
MNELINSTVDMLTNRPKTKVYRIFFIWLIIFHIEIIYFALFVDQDLFFKANDILKFEYMKDNYFNTENISFWINEFVKVLASIVLALATIFILPGLSKVVYKKEVSDRGDLEYIKFLAEKESQDRREELVKREKYLADKSKKIDEEKREILNSNETIWRREYKRFSSTQAFNGFSDIIKAVTHHNNRIRDNTKNFHIDSDTLSYAIAANLIEADPMRNTFSLTEKGKFFILQYQN